MSEDALEIWLHTRGETWDYRWITASTANSTGPTGADLILKQVSPSDPSAPAAILVWHDGSHLFIATGSYSDRKDRHLRRIQQSVVVSQQCPIVPPISRVLGMASALSVTNLTPLASMLATYEIGAPDFYKHVSRLLVIAHVNVPPHPSDGMITPENLHSLIETRSLLCVDPKLSFSELCATAHQPDQRILGRFYYGSGIHDPSAMVGKSGIISTSKPLLQFGATAGESVVFGPTGDRSLYRLPDLPRSPIKPPPLTDMQEFVKSNRRRWGILPARGSFRVK
jgi:hypothetical protein